MSYLHRNFCLALILGLTIALIMGGCSWQPQSTAAPPPTVTSAARLQLPQATATPPPTAIPTGVVSPTGSPTPAPTKTAQPTPTATPEPAALKYVILISIDGLRPDALELADTPTLDALRLAGAYSPSAKAVLPSVTLVNHASMLGGMHPRKHGVTWNVRDPKAGKVKGPTLFTAAHNAGLTSMMVVGKAKLDHLVLPDSVDQYYHPGYTDRQVINKALQIIDAGLPDILFIHLPDVDSAGHLTGWMLPGQILAIELTDSLIGKLVTALETEDYLENTLLIITADHGGEDFAHGTASPEDTTIPWLAVGPGLQAGVVLKSDIVVYDTAATILYALDLPIPEVWDGKPVVEIFE